MLKTSGVQGLEDIPISVVSRSPEIIRLRCREVDGVSRHLKLFEMQSYEFMIRTLFDGDRTPG